MKPSRDRPRRGDYRARAATAVGALWRDPVFWIAVVVLGLTAAPSVFPILNDDQLWAWRWFYADLPISVVTFIAVASGIRRVPSVAEKRFWQLVAFAYGVSLVVELADAFVPDGVRTVGSDLALESVHLLFYLGLVLAVGVSRGHLEGRGAWTLDRLRAAGLGLVALGFVVYFQGVPSVAAPEALGPWYPSLFLFAVLDVGLCVTFLYVRREHEDPRWRAILLGMAAVSGTYAVVDAAEATLYLERFFYYEVPPLWDLAWFVPEVLVVVVARRHLSDPQTSTAPGREYRPQPDRGSLIVGLITLPLLHGLLYYLGVLDPELHATRSGVVVAFLVGMGAMALVYMRTLEHLREGGRRQLELSEERYRSFVQARSGGIYRAESDVPLSLDQPPERLIEDIQSLVRIVEVSDPTGLALCGSTPESQIGRSIIDLLDTGLPSRRAVVTDWIDSGYDLDVVVEKPRPDGQTRYLSCSLIGVVEDGALVRVWVTLADVTDQRLAAVENERLERELEQSRRLETIGTLAGGIAHDFNNLLLPIMGFTELAKLSARPDDGGTRESLDRVLLASQRAADLVQQVLAMSREQPHREVAVRMQDVVDEAVRLVRHGLPATVRIETELEEDCPPILGDPSRVHQVVVNLGTNAYQAIGTARGRIRITLQHHPATDAAAPHGWVVFTVQDDGPGVDPRLAPRIFEPFFTTKEPGEGTGLGLSVVHGIVTSHGGTVTMDSELGSGTTFTVKIPATDAVSAFEPIDLDEAGARLRVLVVDDEGAISDMTKMMLEAEGHVATSFTDPVLALETFRARPGDFDLIVTDQTMPGLTGLELALAARRCEAEIQVVIMSGYHVSAKQGEDGFLRLDKPFTSAKLAATVRLAAAQRLESDDGAR